MNELNPAIRLKGFIDSLGLSYSQFADECGIPRPTLSQLLNGRNKKISDVLVGQIHRAYPSLSILWLLFGEGPMIESSPSPTELTNVNNEENNSVDNSNMPEGSLQNTILGFENSKITSSPSNINLEENVRALSKGSESGQNIDNRLVEAQFKIAELQLQIEKLRQNPRKVSQITIYYDDSTFETFFPKLEKP